MPLFGHKNRDAAPVEPTPTARGHHRRRSSSLSSSDLEGTRKTGFFGRKRSTSSERLRRNESTLHSTGRLSHNSTRSSGGGLFNRHPEDPTIAHARERVLSAENAEREADRALVQARAAVKEAREHIKLLEKEAAEEYVTSRTSKLVDILY